MAHYRSRFTGHIEAGDPRTPITVAGGCRWPTVPPFRVLFSSTTATGIYRPWNTEPVLFELNLESAQHSYGIWEAPHLPWWLYSAWMEKFYNRDLFPRWRYHFTFMMTLRKKQEIAVASLTGRCNVDVTFGDEAGGPLRGRLGHDFGFKQVEFDQLEPPA